MQYHGGKELLQRIDELSEKVDTYKKQCADEAQHGDEVAPLNNEANHHHISIIKPERLKASVIKNAQNVKNRKTCQLTRKWHQRCLCGCEHARGVRDF